MYEVQSVIYRQMKFSPTSRFVRYLALVTLDGVTGKVRIDRNQIVGEQWVTEIYTDIPGFSTLENPLAGIEGVNPLTTLETPDVLIEITRLHDHKIT